MSKRVLAAGLFAVIVMTMAVGYAVRLPDASVRDLRAALQAGDEAAIGSHVDFDALREHLKRQLLASFTAAAPDERMALAASRYVSPLVDSLVTPAGLARLGAGDDPLATASARWSGLSGAVVVVEGAGGAPSRWLLQRRGLTFVLVGVELPDAMTAELERRWSERLAAAPPTPADDRGLEEDRARACAAWRKIVLARLQAITVAQRAHLGEHGRYSDDVAALLGGAARGPDLYDFVITRADERSFAVEARGKDLMAGDVLVADDTGIRVLADRCAR